MNHNISILATWYVNQINVVEPDTQEFFELTTLIDQWSHDTRIGVREKLEQWGCKQLVRNLYCDYSEQKWIVSEAQAKRLAL